MGFQKQATNTLNIAFRGQFLDSNCQNKIVAAVIPSSETITVGYAVWQVTNTLAPYQVNQAKGSNAKPLGFFVSLSMSQSATLGITTSASVTASGVQTVPIAKSGTIAVVVDRVVGTGAVAQWDNVYIDNATGAVVVVSAGGAVTGLTKLNWQFLSESTALVAGNLVKITNQLNNDTQISA